MDAPPSLDEDLELLMNKVSGWEKKIPDIAKYRESIKIPETVIGDVGGCEQPEKRFVRRASPQGQAIVAREAALQNGLQNGPRRGRRRGLREGVRAGSVPVETLGSTNEACSRALPSPPRLDA